jgi:hypothetical protein
LSRQKKTRKTARVRHARAGSKTARRGRKQARARHDALGTTISRLFKGIGLRPGEEIPELRDIHLQIPNFEDF